MKLQTYNGSLSYKEYVILPALENSDFIVEDDSLIKETTEVRDGVEVLAIEVPIIVKRYFKI